MHLYIHIPFCDSKCGYCAFFSKINQDDLIAPYFDALLKDLKHQIEYFNIKKLSSIFVGGGTPNFVDSKYYDKIFEVLKPLCIADCEITLESNPNLLKESWLLHLKNLGLNRLSLGVQSFYADKLNMLERNHSIRDILHAFEIAHKHLSNISLDLIYDCKLDSKIRLEQEILNAINLKVNHISAYSLSIDPSSRFGKKKRYELQSNDGFGEFIKICLENHGFNQYEVSNFAYRNKCRHNLGYWRGNEYLGIGVSAVGRIRDIRYYTSPNLQNYIRNPLKKEKEYLSKKDLEFENIFLGLRSEIGVDKTILNKNKLKIVLDEGLCHESNQRIYSNNFFIADSLSLYLS